MITNVVIDFETLSITCAYNEWIQDCVNGENKNAYNEGSCNKDDCPLILSNTYSKKQFTHKELYVIGAILNEFVELISKVIKDIPESINPIRKEPDLSNYLDLDKIENSFMELGIRIKNSDGSYLCFNDILDKLSEVYDKSGK